MTEAEVVAECCFVDVGQGTCNIILLGGRRAIVIDCGPRSVAAPLRLLNQCGVEFIEALVVTHNDVDHCGGAAQLLGAYPRAIKRIYFLCDRPAERNTFLSLVRQEEEAGNLLHDPVRLESPQSVYEDREQALAVHVLFPAFLQNLTAEKPNQTSAVIALECGARKIVFPGDLEHDQWVELSDEGKHPVTCDVLSVPHHGGDLTGNDRAKRHSWVYDHAVRCRNGVVSVGTVNQPKHPRAHHISALRDSGAVVMCTQMTERCCDDLESVRPGLARPELPGESRPEPEYTSQAKRSRRVACAGTIVVEIGPDAIRVRRLRDHQAAVDKLATQPGGHPLCRQSAASPSHA